MGVFDNPSKMWFGTEAKMMWIDVPQQGADLSSVGMTVDETLLSGGGFVRNSWGAHKRYDFSWGDSSDRRLASQIQGYARGTYGRGLLYFNDPMFYDTNALPPHLADPSMALNFESPSLNSAIEPRSTPTGANTNDLPALTTIYDLPAGSKTPIEEEIVFAVPEGMSLEVGAFYTGTGTARIYATSASGTIALPKITNLNSAVVTNTTFTDPWVRFGIENPSGSAQTVSIVGLVGRLRDSALPADTTGPWMAGEGHTGCRFVGKPTVIAYNGVGGGQVGVAATLVEVGAWES